MGHGDEPMPAEVIEELRERLENQADTIDELHDRLAGKPTPGPLIYGAMIEAMREVVAVGKDGRNTQQNYPFRGIDGVLNAVGPALRKAGIFVTSKIVQAEYRDTLTTGDKKTREFTARIAYTFWAADGSNVTTEVPGESLDQGDKGAAKGMSVAFRIALIQALALPTDEPTTDHDGHYKTRAGTVSLSGWERNRGQRLLTAAVPDVEAILDFWPAIVEAGQVEAPVPWATEAGPTWHESVAARLAASVAAVETKDQGLTLYGLLKPSGALHWAHGGKKLGLLMEERAAEIKVNQVKTFDHCMQLVTSAADLDALENAITHAQADTAPNGVLTTDQYNDVITVAEERRTRLATELNQAASAAPQFLPTVGQAWEEFVGASGQENMDHAQLDELLHGTADLTPACEFGADGVQRFIDAAKRSHSGYQSINANERKDLFEALAVEMGQAGITWHEEIR